MQIFRLIQSSLPLLHRDFHQEKNTFILSEQLRTDQKKYFNSRVSEKNVSNKRFIVDFFQNLARNFDLKIQNSSHSFLFFSPLQFLALGFFVPIRLSYAKKLPF